MSRRLPRWLWPRSMAARLILALVCALVLAQILSFVILFDERHAAIRFGQRDALLSRTATVVRLLRDTPATLHARIVEAASSRQIRFWIDEESALDGDQVAQRENAAARHLQEQLDLEPGSALVEADPAPGRFWNWDHDHRRWRDGRRHHDHDDDENETRAWRNDDTGRPPREQRRRLWLTLSVRLSDRAWLNADTALPPPPPGWAWRTLLSLAMTALAVALIVIFMVRRMTRPMLRLANAADQLGRGEDPRPIPEQGAEEVRRTTRAFNQMRERLARFVSDRTRMLAAISHDLRTPITTLRLRAEFIEDREIREAVLTTLDEMQEMVESTLAFAREDAAREATRTVDLSALIAALCDDLADGGRDITFTEAAPLPYACRPTSLKRALGNLIENAVAYGARARLHIQATLESVEIHIDDDGPGIAPEDRERVFAPFVRLEESRSRETGGVGLGLAIARTIVRAHGGDVLLHNRPEGGLRVTVRLPKAND